MSTAPFAVHVLTPEPIGVQSLDAVASAPTPMARAVVVGFALRGAARCLLRDRIDGLTRLLACLPDAERHGPFVELSFALHYVVRPPVVAGTHAAIGTALLMRVADWSREAEPIVTLARALASELHTLLTECLVPYDFAPITSSSELAQMIAPFTIGALIEVQPRWQPISSQLDLPVPLAGIPSIEPLVSLMSREANPCLLSIGFTPVSLPMPALVPWSEPNGPPDPASGLSVALPFLVTVPHISLEDDGTIWQELSASVDAELRRRWLHERAAMLYRPYQIRVQLASAGKRLGESLIQITAAEFGGPSKLAATPFWSTPLSVMAAGAAVIVPRTTPSDPRTTHMSDFALAESNLLNLRTSRANEHPTSARQTPAEESEHHALSLLASLVSLIELARLAALPTEAAWLPAPSPVLHLPYLGGPARGARIGTNTHGTSATEVQWSFPGRLHHAAILGGTGMGKTTLAEQLILDDIANGRAVVVLDPHDEMVERLLGRIPERLAHKVIVLDVADSTRPLGINLMDVVTPDERAQVVTRFLTQLHSLYDPHNLGMVGPTAMMMLRHGMQAIMSLPHGGTLLEVYRLYADNAFLEAVLPYIRDFTARAFFEQLREMRPADRAEYATHGISKVSEWVSDPMLQRIIGQRTNSFDFGTALNGGAIVLCQLRSGIVGPDKTAFLGHLLIPMIYQAALSRLSRSPGDRPPAALYIDEAGTFTGDPSIARMLSECRKAKLSVNLIYQYIAQADPAVREAVLANCGSVFSFRLGPADAALMERFFAPSAVDAQALTQLPRGVAYAQIMLQDGERTPVFTLATEMPRQRPRAARAVLIREMSALRYGRAIEDVEAALTSRQAGSRWVRDGDTT